MDATKFIGKVMVVKTRDGDRLSGRLIEADEKFVLLKFKNGAEAYVAIDDIMFLSPITNQPAVVT